MHVETGTLLQREEKKFSREPVGNASRGEDLHSSHVNAGNPLYRNPVRARWTQDTSAMTVDGDKLEESIRIHRQLPVCRNDPFFAFELRRGRWGIVIVTSMLLLVIVPHYMSDILWGKSCHLYVTSCCVAYFINLFIAIIMG